MCKAFSCLVGVDNKVTWKLGVDSHSELVTIAGYKDHTSDSAQMTFARVEITPDNNNYLYPDNWTLRVDESIQPSWFGHKHKEQAFAAHKEWFAPLNKILIHKHIVHPFKIAPPEITDKHIALLKKWYSVVDSVGASVWDSVRDSVWKSVGTSVWVSVRASVGASVGDSVWASVWASVGNSVWASVRASVGASARASVGNSVWDSVVASVGAYAGSFFKHPRGKYPLAPTVKLWEQGLVPSFDGTTWRLHGGEDAKVLFSITAEELNYRPKSKQPKPRKRLEIGD